MAHRQTFTKTIERGPNKGDRVRFQVAPRSGKPYPVAVLSDTGSPSTLRNNSGVSLGRSVKSRHPKRRSIRSRR